MGSQNTATNTITNDFNNVTDELLQQVANSSFGTTPKAEIENMIKGIVKELQKNKPDNNKVESLFSKFKTFVNSAEASVKLIDAAKKWSSEVVALGTMLGIQIT